jgi:hypothetical protein
LQPSAEIKVLTGTHVDMQRLMDITGVGPTIATALVAAIRTGTSFGKERDLAARLGLVPRQVTTGEKAIPICISKPGNRYQRKRFILGARTVLHLVRDTASPIAQWADDFKEQERVNVAAVFMTSKMAWNAWAVLTKGELYHPSALTPSAEGMSKLTAWVGCGRSSSPMRAIDGFRADFMERVPPLGPRSRPSGAGHRSERPSA